MKIPTWLKVSLVLLFILSSSLVISLAGQLVWIGNSMNMSECSSAVWILAACTIVCYLFTAALAWCCGRRSVL